MTLLLPCGLLAQDASQVSGIVTDASGAVIPNANLELHNVNTGLKRTTTTDTEGKYSFLKVIPGSYQLTATAAGFRSTTINDLRLLVNNPATVAIKMEIGQMTESVTVAAETVYINTTDASIGNAIGTKPIIELPLNARNIVGLLANQPGVVFTSEDDTDSRNGAVNGGKSDQANVTLDGVDVNDQMDRSAFTSVLRMTPDSIQEFRVTTLNANPESGRTSGAQVVMRTKSGTNELHGSLYEYHRNTLTEANDFFLNQSGIERRKLIRNLFGTSLGGPIKKDRLFFFANYEGRRDAKDGQEVRAVPSMDMRQGILHYLREDGTVATVTPDVLTAQVDPRGLDQAALKLMQSYPVPNDTTQGDGLNITGYRFKAPTPLRWNTYISKVDYALDGNGKHTLFVRGNLQNDHESLVPQFPGQPSSLTLRNNKGIAVGLTSLLSSNLISSFHYGLTRQGNEQTGIAKISATTLRGLDDPIDLTNRGFAAIIPVHQFSEDITWTKGDHSVQFGAVARFIRNNRTSLNGSYSNAVANASWLVDSGNELNAPFTDLDQGQVTYFNYAVADVLGLISQGNAQYNYKVDGTVLGEGAPVFRNFASNEYEMYFQDTWKVNRALTVTGGIRWSLMPPIYEANGQQVSPDQRIGDWFDKRGALAQQGKPTLDAGRISFIPTNGGGRPLYDYHKKNFAPRLSLAYSPQGGNSISRFLFGEAGKTSIRAGWGMYYDLFGSGLMRSFDATAFGLSTSLTNPSAVLSATNAPKFTALDQLPAEVMLPAPPAKFPAVYPDVFAITRGIDDTIRPPYNMSANFSIGREFSGGWFVQGSYVGRFSRRSLIRRDAGMPANLVDPKSGMAYFDAATILAKQVVAGVPTAQVAKVPFWENLYSKAATSSLTATQVVYNRFVPNMWDWTYALYQLDTPTGYGNCVVRKRCSDLGPWAFFHPQFSYLSVFSSVGGGNYNGAQFSVRKRFDSGDTVDFNYTFSKSMDLRSNTERAGYSTGVIWNPWYPGLSKGVSDYDNTHLFNMQGVYALPLGKGKRYATSAKGFVNALIGGWQIAGLWRWSSGFPVSVYSTGVWPTNWNNNNWAIWNGGAYTTGQTKNATAPDGTAGPNMFQNPKAALDAYEPVMPGQIGMRNSIRGDGIFNIDTNLSKRFKMPWRDGKHSIELRWETFNLTNTAKFDVIDASLDVAVTGTFGKYMTQLTKPREMQFGLRYDF